MIADKFSKTDGESLRVLDGNKRQSQASRNIFGMSQQAPTTQTTNKLSSPAKKPLFSASLKPSPVV
jgi:hypothetical protein